MRYLDEGTPLHRALGQAATALEPKLGRAALVIWSDGLPSDSAGRSVPPEAALDEARALVNQRAGEVCIHTVQVGEDPPGADFLRDLSALTKCGSHRSLASLQDPETLADFERAVFLEKKKKQKKRKKKRKSARESKTEPAKKPPKPRDRDGDGVSDGSDQCPGTPAGAQVDRRGCWTMPWLLFETNRAVLTPESERQLLEEVLPVIRDNADLELRIDGHTDDRGSAEYNRDLSQRRAEAVRRFLIDEGISAKRLQARGFGESQPLVPNDSDENLARNRRTEFTVLSR